MNNRVITDSDLIKATIEGDPQSFKLFVERYQKLIFSYLYRFLYQSREAAEDVTQTVFLKVYQNLNAIDNSKSIKPWLYRIAHNEAANYLRSISRKKEVSFDAEQWSQVASKTNELENSKEDQSKLIQLALNKVKPKYREVIVLFYFEEKSYEEIAAILKTTTNSAGTLIRRAKQDLKKILEKQVPDISSILLVLIISRLWNLRETS